MHEFLSQCEISGVTNNLGNTVVVFSVLV